MNVRRATAADRAAISDILTASWGSHLAVAHGTSYDASTLPALVAAEDDRILGLLTYTVDDEELEVVTIDALEPRESKLSIPLTGAYGIPLHDELVLELRLDQG